MIYDSKPKCSICSKYCGYGSDRGIRYGCNYTPDPEPLDEEYFCTKCAIIKQHQMEEEIIKNGEGDFRYCNWWQIPSFVSKALKSTGYSMTRNSGNTVFILSKTKSISDLQMDLEDEAYHAKIDDELSFNRSQQQE